MQRSIFNHRSLFQIQNPADLLTTRIFFRHLARAAPAIPAIWPWRCHPVLPEANRKHTAPGLLWQRVGHDTSVPHGPGRADRRAADLADCIPIDRITAYPVEF